jgi:WD40 repeat protein
MRSLQCVEFHNTLEDPQAIRRLVQGIRGETADASATSVPITTEPPYPGLRSFGESDARFFFGRASQIEELIGILHAAIPSRTDGIEVVGASGSGKTSLVLAGLIPKLRENALEGSSTWPVVVFRPGPDPLRSFAAALGPLKPNAPPDYWPLDMLWDNGPPSEIADRIRGAVRIVAVQSPVLIVADQFDEVFSECRDYDCRRAFIDLMAHLAPATDWRTLVVVTMRSEYTASAASFGWGDGGRRYRRLDLRTMTREEMIQAIERPAQLVSCEVEPGLVELLLRDVEGQPGVLPLLQQVLLDLWRRREGRRLTIRAYRDLGGIVGSLDRTASQVYGNLGELAPLSRLLLLAMVRPAGDDHTVRRQLPLARLPEDRQGDRTLTRTVVNRLVDARLVTTSTIGDDPSTTVIELAHEALISTWTTLRQWIDEDRAALQTRDRIIDAAQDWGRRGRDSKLLYTGDRLEAAIRWRDAHPGELVPLESSFLDESLLEATGSHVVRWLRYTRRAVGRVLVAIPTRFAQAGFVLTLIALVVLGYFAKSAHDASATKNEDLQKQVDDLDKQLNEAKGAENAAQRMLEVQRALSRRIEAMRLAALAQNALKTNPQESVLLATEAFRITVRAKEPPVPAAEQALRDALGDAGSRVLDTVPPLGPPLLAFSRDGNKLATAGKGAINLWDLTAVNPAASPVTIAAKVQVAGLALAPDARSVVIGTDDGTVSLAELGRPNATFKPLGKFPGAVRALTVNSDYQLVAVDNTGVARMWSLLEVTEPPTQAAGMNQMLTSVVINAERRQVAASTADGHIRVYSPDSRAGPALDFAFDGPTDVLAIGPNGDWLAAAGKKGVRLWHLTAAKPAAAFFVLGGNARPVSAAAFMRNPDALITGSEDGGGRLWHLDGADPTAAPSVLPAGATGVTTAVASDSRLCGLGYRDAQVRLWDLTASSVRPAGPITLSAAPGPVVRAAFSPNGRWLVTATHDYRLWPFGEDVLLRLAQQVAGRNFTHAEWDRLFPDQPYRATFEKLPGGAGN